MSLGAEPVECVWGCLWGYSWVLWGESGHWEADPSGLGKSLGQRLDGAGERKHQPMCGLGGVCSCEGASQGTVVWGEQGGAGICNDWLKHHRSGCACLHKVSSAQLLASWLVACFDLGCRVQGCGVKDLAEVSGEQSRGVGRCCRMYGPPVPCWSAPKSLLV